MLDADRSLKSFVEKLTAINRGRAFFTTPESLGDYVLVHVGFALSVIDAEEARRTYELFEEMGQLAELAAEQPSERDS